MWGNVNKCEVYVNGKRQNDSSKTSRVSICFVHAMYVVVQCWLSWSWLTRSPVDSLGIPGCSWRGNLQVSEEGRAMAARLLGQLTDQQITDVFTAARANLMRNDSIADWVAGFKDKLQREVVGTACPAKHL
jgi:hypothetical protein